MAPTAKGMPGRRRIATNQYFSPGKVGRKTGVVLVDTGIRDEYGMEPMDIFSSPEKDIPKRRTRRATGDRTLSSTDMAVPDSSASEHTEIFASRKAPRLPPPRSSTPKHTNIGSPKRHSSVHGQSRGQSIPAGPPSEELQTADDASQPPANRILHFGNNLRRSIESLSPFKPKVTLRRSIGSARTDPFVSGEPSESEPEAQEGQLNDAVAEQVDAEKETQQPALVKDDFQPMLENDDSLQTNTLYEDTVTARIEESVHYASPKRRAARPRKSVESDPQQTQPVAETPSTAASKKRGRESLDAETDAEDATGDIPVSQLDDSNAGPAQKKHRGRPRKSKELVVNTNGENAMISPQLLVSADEYLANDASENRLQSQPAMKGKRGRKAKGALKDRYKNAQLQDNTRATDSHVELNECPSKLHLSPSKRGGSLGPVSNVNLRSSTPFEDAGTRVSRFGRPIMDPLKYWQNETLVWKDGQIDGVVRAQEVEVAKPRNGRRTTKARKRRATSRLSSVEEEESETESVSPEEWEGTLGVLSGTVAGWDPEHSTGDLESEMKEDLAFASTAIMTREVAGSAFRYAKIMTLPFIGCGIVELAPEGYKREKNSRKMHMVFFVHKGKVLVQVGAVGSDGNEFAITEGGVWVVPRGNNYAITNESTSKTARIFFAQGCEINGARDVSAAA